MSNPTFGPGGLESMLDGMDRGGIPISHGDGLQGLGYVERFDVSQLERSGNPLVRPITNIDRDHVDVIERASDGEILHHRIYNPNL